MTWFTRIVQSGSPGRSWRTGGRAVQSSASLSLSLTRDSPEVWRPSGLLVCPRPRIGSVTTRFAHISKRHRLCSPPAIRGVELGSGGYWNVKQCCSFRRFVHCCWRRSEDCRSHPGQPPAGPFLSTGSPGARGGAWAAFSARWSYTALVCYASELLFLVVPVLILWPASRQPSVLFGAIWGARKLLRRGNGYFRPPRCRLPSSQQPPGGSFWLLRNIGVLFLSVRARVWSSVFAREP